MLFELLETWGLALFLLFGLILLAISRGIVVKWSERTNMEYCKYDASNQPSAQDVNFL